MLDKLTTEGDIKAIRELSRMYNQLLETKENFVHLAVRQAMTPIQRAEAELRLAMLTGELKRVDGLIHYMMFGGEVTGNELCEGLHWQYEKQKNLEEGKQLRQIREHNKELVVENFTLRNSRDYYRWEASKGKKAVTY